MSSEILFADSRLAFDESIVQYYYNIHATYAFARYGNNVYPFSTGVLTLPAGIFSRIGGKLVTNDAALNVKFVNNAIDFLFEEIRCEVTVWMWIRQKM